MRELLRDDISRDITAAICQRIISAQALYFIAALPCIVNRRYSIAFVLALQIFFSAELRLPGARERPVTIYCGFCAGTDALGGGGACRRAIRSFAGIA